jgi:uncharacterized protein (TIRG00374 family)
MVIGKKIGGMVLRISISLALLIFLFKQVDPESLFKIFKKSDKMLIYLSFLITFFGYFFCFLRWKMLLNIAGIKLPDKRLISAFSGGIFFNTFLPSSIVGDFVRSSDIGYHSKKTDTVIATVLLDRLSGFAGMIAMTMLALVFGPGLIKDQRIIYTIWLLTGLLVLVMLVIFNNFIYGLVEKIFCCGRPGVLRSGIKSVFSQVHDFKQHKAALVKNLLMSMAIQSIAPITTYFLIVSFRLEANILYFFLVIPVITAVTVLPISIGGLGVRDYLMVLLFAGIGISKHFALACSLLEFFYMLVYAGIGGIIYVLTLHNRRV